MHNKRNKIATKFIYYTKKQTQHGYYFRNKILMENK